MIFKFYDRFNCRKLISFNTPLKAYLIFLRIIVT